MNLLSFSTGLQIEAPIEDRIEDARIRLKNAYDVMFKKPTPYYRQKWSERKRELQLLFHSNKDAE